MLKLSLGEFTDGLGTSMKSLLRAATVALLFSPLVFGPCFGATEVAAQNYPNRPVRIIVPFGAGGPGDTYTRLLAQQLSESMKQPFIVEARPGAAAIIGSDFVAKSPPDGYTLLDRVELAHHQRVAQSEPAVQPDEGLRRRSVRSTTPTSSWW